MPTRSYLWTFSFLESTKILMLGEVIVSLSAWKKFPPNSSFSLFLGRSYLYSQKRTLRSFFPLAYGWRSKYIAKPRKVLELGNHEIWKGTKGTKGYKVSPKDGLSFHYRDSCLDNQCSMPTLPDETAKRYGPQLYHSVDEVCSLIFDKGFCPIENSKMKNYTRKKIRKKRNPHLALSK